jgi:DNA-directed RNA polymerase subunit beta'
LINGEITENKNKKYMLKNYINAKIASPQKILSWSERSLYNGKLIGEVKNSQITNKKDIFESLFCERIFGPTKDNECWCKKYKKIKETKNINICKICSVEITKSNIRNYKIGFINIKTDIIHPWYFKRNPNYISIILNKSRNETNNIIYNKSYININKNKITGGEAIKILLRKINLEETSVFNKN